MDNDQQYWARFLGKEFEKDYFKELMEFVEEEYSVKSIYPKREKIFAALECCPFEKVKVVILGQDPYHGIGQANGLCFSVNDGVKVPPSLRNIKKEIADDLGVKMGDGGDLEKWTQQGVLLLNKTLTVEEGKAGSHQKKGWEVFTNAIIEFLVKEKEDLVFMLWGKDAQKKIYVIDEEKHLVLTAVHPSPLSAYRGFFGCKHFSKANDYLKGKGLEEIDWRV